MTVFTRAYNASLVSTQPSGYTDATTVQHAARTVYSQGFEGIDSTSPDTWIASGAAGAALQSAYWTDASAVHSGRYSLGMTISATGTIVASRTVTGLTVGRSATLTAWVKGTYTGQSASVGVTGIGSSPTTPMTGQTGWTALSFTFKPTATSHVVALTVVSAQATGGVGFWDDITVVHPAYLETVPPSPIVPAPVQLDVKAGSVTLDEGWSPFVQGSLVMAKPTPDILALIDPTLSPRLQLSASTFPLTGTSTSLFFDLLVTARLIDSNTGEVTINFTNDESLAQDYLPTSAINYGSSQGSVRSIVNAVLTKALGKATTAAFASGADVAIPTYQDLQNYIPVPSFEVSSGMWVATRVTLAQATNWKQVGTYSLKVTPSDATNSGSYATIPVSLSPGKQYTFTAYMRTGPVQTGAFNGDARKLQMTAVVNGVESIIGRSAQGANTANTTSKLTMTFTVPLGATATNARLVNGATSSADNSTYWDAIMLLDGDGNDTNGTALAYFDGDSANSTTYTYAWDGSAGLSTSRRTAVVQRDPGVLLWTPDTSAWSFLVTILQAVGLRLWQDTDRSWRLADNGYGIARVVRINNGDNLYTAQDLMSRTATQDDGTPLFVDAVNLKYTWTDALGNSRTAFDYAGPVQPTKPYYVEYADTPFPGVGRAGWMLSRLKVRSRQMSVTGATDFSIRPGMAISITTPDTANVTGYLDAVSWDFGGDEMSVKSKGLVLTPTGAWINKTTTWATLAGTWAAQ